MNVEVDRIINEICTIIEEDPLLESFDIFPATQTEAGDSAVMYADHNLALRSWSLKDLYSYVHSQLLHGTAVRDREMKLLTVALLLNPHVKTFWNRRRKLVSRENLDLHSELRYAALILTYKSKAQDVFTYRKWLLQRIFEKRLEVGSLLVDEMAVIENAAGRFDNNHMAWDYAHWLLDFAEQNVCAKDNLQSFWIRNSSWISTHITDFSAYGFRQKLVRRLIHYANVLDATFKTDIAGPCKEYSEYGFSIEPFQFEFSLIIKEMESNENSIRFYVDHESLWHYRRFLYFVFIEILPPIVAQQSQYSHYKWYKATLDAIDRSFSTYACMNNDMRFFLSHSKWLKNFGILIYNKS